MLQMLTGGIGAGVSGLLFTVLTALFPAPIIGLLTNDAAIIVSGVEYLKVMCWTFVVCSISSVLMYSLQSVQTVFHVKRERQKIAAPK